MARTIVPRRTFEYREHSTPHNPFAMQASHPHILDSEQVELIRTFLSEKPTLYLDEIQDYLMNTFGASISLATL